MRTQPHLLQRDDTLVAVHIRTHSHRRRQSTLEARAGLCVTVIVVRITRTMRTPDCRGTLFRACRFKMLQVVVVSAAVQAVGVPDKQNPESSRRGNRPADGTGGQGDLPRRKLESRWVHCRPTVCTDALLPWCLIPSWCWRRVAGRARQCPRTLGLYSCSKSEQRNLKHVVARQGLPVVAGCPLRAVGPR